jgi:hypothetical protein
LAFSLTNSSYSSSYYSSIIYLTDLDLLFPLLDLVFALDFLLEAEDFLLPLLLLPFLL